MRIGHHLRLGAIVVVLGATAWLGLAEGWVLTRTGVTTGQHVATGTQLAYGVFALLALAGVLARRRWAFIPLALWGLALTATAALAPVVWGKSGWQAALAGGAGAAVVAALVLWGGRRHIARAEARPDAGR
jgi:MYXO-CTERM domain-containing protein